VFSGVKVTKYALAAPLGKLTTLLQTHIWIRERRGEEKGWEETKEKREGREMRVDSGGINEGKEGKGTRRK